ncbi:unnamed protein product [Didymodactylos carnosus]|nr:unnamed protein product [Didymodactylos carnosus]CAF3885365.1 unnamed protein product [Didymodactylos carnosus]
MNRSIHINNNHIVNNSITRQQQHHVNHSHQEQILQNHPLTSSSTISHQHHEEYATCTSKTSLSIENTNYSLDENYDCIYPQKCFKSSPVINASSPSSDNIYFCNKVLYLTPDETKLRQKDQSCTTNNILYNSSDYPYLSSDTDINCSTNDNYYSPSTSTATVAIKTSSSLIDDQTTIYYNDYPNTTANRYNQFSIDTTPNSSWLTSTESNYPVQSFEQQYSYSTTTATTCDNYINTPKVYNITDTNNLNIKDNHSSDSLSSSSSSTHNNHYVTQQPARERSSSNQIALQQHISETRYKWMQVKRNPAKTAGK